MPPGLRTQRSPGHTRLGFGIAARMAVGAGLLYNGASLGPSDGSPSSRMRPDDRPEPGNVPPHHTGRPGGLGKPGRRRGDPGRDDLDELGLEAGAPQVPVPVDRRSRRPAHLRRLVAGIPQGPPARPGQPEASPARAAGPDHAGRRRAVDHGPGRSAGGEEGGRLGPRPGLVGPGRARPAGRPPVAGFEVEPDQGRARADGDPPRSRRGSRHRRRAWPPRRGRPGRTRLRRLAWRRGTPRRSRRRSRPSPTRRTSHPPRWAAPDRAWPTSARPGRPRAGLDRRTRAFPSRRGSTSRPRGSPPRPRSHRPILRGWPSRRPRRRTPTRSPRSSPRR